MSTNAMLDSASPLTPSDLVLLNGEQFAQGRSWAERIELINIDAAVDAKQLGQTMLAAAFLANEQAGAIRLEVHQNEKKTFLFGRLTVKELYITPGVSEAVWPKFSLESLVHTFFESQVKTVSDFIQFWMPGDYNNPWKEVGNLIYKGLADRGLLEVSVDAISERQLWGKSGYVLPDHVASLARQQPIDPVRQLLATRMQARPEVELLVKEINSAIDQCRKQYY